jgi:SAM-dependent methyltransferase
VRLRQRIREWVNRAGYDVQRLPSGSAVGRTPTVAYVENPEYKFRNLQQKLDRLAAGGPFEYPEIVVLNRTVADMARGATRVAEVGGGTGCFAYEFGRHPGVRVVSSEYDPETSSWAAAERAHPNIHYTTEPITAEEGPFDLVVSVEVIEHVPDYTEFLQSCVRLAPRSIITTPNRARRRERHRFDGPPSNRKHVREWTGGEFYWVLRCFYRAVQLYARDDTDPVGCSPAAVSTTKDRLIALCEAPRHLGV